MSRPAVEGKCEACGDPAVRTVKYRGKRRRGCNRCTARARTGGDFMVPRKRMLDRQARIIPRMKKLRRRGLNMARVAKMCRLSRATAFRWLDNDRTA